MLDSSGEEKDLFVSVITSSAQHTYPHNLLYTHTEWLKLDGDASWFRHWRNAFWRQNRQFMWGRVKWNLTCVQGLCPLCVYMDECSHFVSLWRNPACVYMSVCCCGDALIQCRCCEDILPGDDNFNCRVCLSVWHLLVILGCCKCSELYNMSHCWWSDIKEQVWTDCGPAALSANSLHVFVWEKRPWVCEREVRLYVHALIHVCVCVNHCMQD